MATFQDAHAALRQTAALQFDFAKPPPTPAPWHLHLNDTLVLGILIVIALAGITAGGVAVLRNRAMRAAPTPVAPAVAAVVPLPAAKAALADADALAAAGRFLEAVHVLLACGVDAIRRLDLTVLRPADTSRDILRFTGLPAATRSAFGALARTVELGVFGGRPVGEDGYAECRATFVGSTMAAPQ